ncbi:hypothetical protein TrST_g1710 [Triparma strigata]|uniref:AAA+ ATPase domain-containing protein n=1 Tax=Triparma strigata TaxID=1606541 RepID=A0A9W6ZJH7_9STRA|nr:hypothetical protein TrST_g1710 [Triparma strigata]
MFRTVSSYVWRAKVPKGFEKFYPKNGGAPKGKSSSKTSKDSTSSSGDKSNPNEDLFKSKFNSANRNQSKKSFGGGGGGNKPDENNLMSLAGLVGASALLSYLYGPKDSAGGREINWSEFRNTLIPSGEVDRIVVTNKNVARVIMKPGSRVAQNIGGSPISGRGTALGGYQGGGENKGDQWGDSTSIELSADISGGSTSTTYDSSTPQPPPINPFSPIQPSFYFTIGSVESFERKLEVSQREMNIPPSDFVPVQYVTETSWGSEIMKLAPTALIIGAWFFMMRGAAGGGGGGGMGNVFKIGKSNAKKIKKEEITTTFKDVAGCQEAKKEIMEFVDFLQDSTRFTKLGAKIPKGALLCGPPGTGKTLLAKAVAGEASVPFYSISGSDFIEMFVGVGPSRVRDLFKEARANAPSIIFIDEIDAVGRQRGKGGFSGGNDERENTLNQLLVEMDGFSESSGVVVLAGTNRADILDNALTRPGRFDRQITVDKPDIEGRKEIFLVHLKGINLEGEPEEYAGRLAGLTPGMAGADIANMCNEAAIQAARRKADAVAMVDFEKASDRVIGGLESNKLISEKEKEIVAHHEAGHAVAGWFLEHADPLMKVTIIPRSSGALGFAQYLPKEVFLRTRKEIEDIICMALAGRAAEQIIFGQVTTGASDDLRRVTGMVYQMIQVYGMNESIGQLSFPKDEGNPYAGNPYSDATSQAMDEQAKVMVDESYTRTLELLEGKKEELVKVAQLLMEKETINHDDIVDLIGARPFEGDKIYEDYIKNKRHGVEVEAEEEEGVEEKKEEEEEVGGGGIPPLGLAFKGGRI